MIKKLLSMRIVKFIYETLNNSNIRAEDVSVKTVSVLPISTCFHITNVNASPCIFPGQGFKSTFLLPAWYIGSEF